MGTEKLDTQVRQEQIAQAALNLIGTRGLKGLSVAEVARGVGLVPSAIYRHFKNKDAVLDAAVDLIRERFMRNVTQVCEETPEAPERLHRLLMRHAELIRENRAIPHLIFSQDVYFDHSERKAEINRILRGYLRKVEEIVRQGQQEGQIRDDLDPETVSVVFLGMIQPAAVLWHLSDGQFNVVRHTEKAWEILRKSILAE